jgi:hypothetical protein
MTSERRTSLDLAGLAAGIEQPLSLIDNPQRRAELQAFVNAARPHIERAAFDLLSQAVAAFNDAVPDQRARLEYDAGALRLAIEPRSAPHGEPAFDEGEPERVTLRLPKELKDLIDGLASRGGMSANNWYVRELSRVIGRHLGDELRFEVRGQRRGYRGRRSSLKGFVGGEEGQGL